MFVAVSVQFFRTAWHLLYPFVLLGLGHWPFYYNCPLQRLLCSDVFIHKMVSFSSPGFIILPMMCTVSTVLNIHSTEGCKESLYLQFSPKICKYTVWCSHLMYFITDKFFWTEQSGLLVQLPVIPFHSHPFIYYLKMKMSKRL
jgi:olfactory receptor